MGGSKRYVAVTTLQSNSFTFKSSYAGEFEESILKERNTVLAVAGGVYNACIGLGQYAALLGTWRIHTGFISGATISASKVFGGFEVSFDATRQIFDAWKTGPLAAYLDPAIRLEDRLQNMNATFVMESFGAYRVPPFSGTAGSPTGIQGGFPEFDTPTIQRRVTYVGPGTHGGGGPTFAELSSGRGLVLHGFSMLKMFSLCEYRLREDVGLNFNLSESANNFPFLSNCITSTAIPDHPALSGSGFDTQRSFAGCGNSAEPSNRIWSTGFPDITRLGSVGITRPLGWTPMRVIPGGRMVSLVNHSGTASLVNGETVSGFSAVAAGVMDNGARIVVIAVDTPLWGSAIRWAGNIEPNNLLGN